MSLNQLAPGLTKGCKIQRFMKLPNHLLDIYPRPGGVESMEQIGATEGAIAPCSSGSPWSCQKEKNSIFCTGITCLEQTAKKILPKRGQDPWKGPGSTANLRNSR